MGALELDDDIARLVKPKHSLLGSGAWKGHKHVVDPTELGLLNSMRSAWKKIHMSKVKANLEFTDDLIKPDDGDGSRFGYVATIPIPLLAALVWFYSEYTATYGETTLLQNEKTLLVVDVLDLMQESLYDCKSVTYVMGWFIEFLAGNAVLGAYVQPRNMLKTFKWICVTFNKAAFNRTSLKVSSAYFIYKSLVTQQLKDKGAI